MLDIEVNGITKAIPIIGNKVLLSWRRVVDKNGAIKKIIDIRIRLIIREIGISEKNNLMLFFFSSAINLDIAIGSPNWLSPMNREKVGSIIIYRPNPSVPISLLISILMIIPNILVNSPPINNIITDSLKLLFILNIMFFF